MWGWSASDTSLRNCSAYAVRSAGPATVGTFARRVREWRSCPASHARRWCPVAGVSPHVRCRDRPWVAATACHQPPRHVQHVPGLQDHFGQRRPFGLLRGFDVQAERVRTGRPVQVPPLRPFELEDHRVVVVPVDPEGLGRVPGRVQVGLDVGAEVPLQRLGEVLNAGVELVHGVQDQGGAGAEPPREIDSERKPHEGGEDEQNQGECLLPDQVQPDGDDPGRHHRCSRRRRQLHPPAGQPVPRTTTHPPTLGDGGASRNRHALRAYAKYGLLTSVAPDRLVTPVRN